METINVKINGVDYTVAKGSTVLEAAKAANIDIPTTHEGNDPLAAVKAEASSRLLKKKLQPNSATPPTKRKNMI